MEIGKSKSEKDDLDKKEMLKSMMNKDEEITKRSTFSSKEVKHKNMLALNAKISNNTENCTREPFVRFMKSLDQRVPKHIITRDEKYILFCPELVYASAMRGVSCSSVPSSLSLQMSTLSHGAFSLYLNSRYSYDSSDFVKYFPLEAGIIRHETMGMTTRSKGGVNSLKHPSFRQYVGSESGILDERADLIDVTKSASSTISMSYQFSISSVPRPEKKMAVFESERFKLETEHRRHVLLSSTSIVSDRSSFSILGNFNRGMLRCTLKAGLPRYVFSLDDCNEVYAANMIKPEPQNYNGFDYLYAFYSNDAYLAGTMRVSSSFKLCSNDMEIKQTEFVLFGEDERDTRKVQTLTSHNVKKSKGLSKKMSEIFKTSHASREKAAYKYPSTNEKSFFDLSNEFSTNLELASIIVKDYVCMIRREQEVGGWGMKFLKKTKLKIANSSIDTSPSPCDYFVENNRDCSTSTNIIIPHGFHGVPRTKIDGPSSLIERWRSGGKCDCGGWDIGCPITVLDTKRSEEENLSQIDIRVSGMQDSSPVMKMVSIRDGLYIIHFESNLSVLQSFAIAVSIIHSQTVQ